MSRPEAIAAVHKRVFSDTATDQSKPGIVQPVANMSVADTLEEALIVQRTAKESEHCIPVTIRTTLHSPRLILPCVAILLSGLTAMR